MLAIVAGVLAAPSSAAVRKVSFTSTVSAGDYASLTVSVSPRTRCSITVTYATGASKASGLGRKSGGRITWRWRVGTKTTPGRWPVVVDCGKSGRLRVTLRTRV